MKNPLSLKRHLYVLVHSGTGTPYAFQLNLQQLTSAVVMTALVFAGMLLGSLMFFRELELNRKLQDQLLDLETREKLAQMLPTNAPATNTPAANRATAAVAAPATETENGEERAVSATAGRLSELAVDCQRGRCGVKLSLMSNGAASAEGQLLIVLEAEVPRIGSANTPGTAVRKRFYIYPGELNRDELDQTAVNQLERKSFRFSHVLQTNVTFEIGKLMRPLAVNAYVYDKDRTLVQHERRAIDAEGGADNDTLE